LANLSLKDTLKSTIMMNRGLEALLYHFRNSENVEGQRIAAKALVNLSSGNRDIKLKIINEIDDEIKKMHRNELDALVTGYI